MRALLCLLSIMSASAALAQHAPADTMTVTAERLSRGALRAQATKFMRKALADTRNGQNARWFTPLCPVALGVDGKVGQLFTSRIADVARHVGLKLAGGDCDPNVAVVFTRDARTLVKTVNRRQSGALDALPGPERALLNSPTLPVRWWHFTAPESADGKPFSPGPLGLGASANGLPGEITYNNNARASRLDLPSRVGITGAVIVVDIDRIGAVSMAALTDYVALVALSRLRMNARERPEGSIMALFDPGAPRFNGLTDQDERFIEAMYGSPATVEGWRQRGDMAGRMADAAAELAKIKATPPQ
ncbi:hypothetical protein [Sandarakinorhabdus limnophila]|uniref:hypothetical protein n=1 Tax=Sandarakinorhabdus limnophila TaxID=210512 RepID=UPI0012EB7561|nr:hypothetical protein [Sandarakinorhabdus limnophila]